MIGAIAEAQKIYAADAAQGETLDNLIEQAEWLRRKLAERGHHASESDNRLVATADHIACGLRRLRRNA